MEDEGVLPDDKGGAGPIAIGLVTALIVGGLLWFTFLIVNTCLEVKELNSATQTACLRAGGIWMERTCVWSAKEKPDDQDDNSPARAR